jgi:hypothetical protein
LKLIHSFFHLVKKFVKKHIIFEEIFISIFVLFLELLQSKKLSCLFFFPFLLTFEFMYFVCLFLFLHVFFHSRKLIHTFNIFYRSFLYCLVQQTYFLILFYFFLLWINIPLDRNFLIFVINFILFFNNLFTFLIFNNLFILIFF